MESKSNSQSLCKEIKIRNYYQSDFQLVQLKYQYSKSYFESLSNKIQIMIFFHLRIQE